MLVLSRKLGESVAIGESDACCHVTKVTVLEIGNSQIKLGFEGPRHVPIHRWEVWERINGRAEKPSTPDTVSGQAAHNWEDDGGFSSESVEDNTLLPAV